MGVYKRLDTRKKGGLTMGLTVQELIDELMKIKDKSKNVATDSWNTDDYPKQIKEIKEYKNSVIIYSKG